MQDRETSRMDSDQQTAEVLESFRAFKKMGLASGKLLQVVEESCPDVVADAKAFHQAGNNGWGPWEIGVMTHPAPEQLEIRDRYYPPDFTFSAKPTGDEFGSRTHLFEEVCELVLDTEAGRVRA